MPAVIILKALRDTSDREIHERLLQGDKENTFLAAHVEVGTAGPAVGWGEKGAGRRWGYVSSCVGACLVELHGGICRVAFDWLTGALLPLFGRGGEGRGVVSPLVWVLALSSCTAVDVVQPLVG